MYTVIIFRPVHLTPLRSNDFHMFLNTPTFTQFRSRLYDLVLSKTLRVNWFNRKLRLQRFHLLLPLQLHLQQLLLPLICPSTLQKRSNYERPLMGRWHPSRNRKKTKMECTCAQPVERARGCSGMRSMACGFPSSSTRNVMQ